MIDWIRTADQLPHDLQDVVFITVEGTVIPGWYAASNNSFFGRSRYDADFVKEWYPLPKLPDGTEWGR